MIYELKRVDCLVKLRLCRTAGARFYPDFNAKKPISHINEKIRHISDNPLSPFFGKVTDN